MDTQILEQSRKNEVKKFKRDAIGTPLSRSYGVGFLRQILNK
jgi:hypothetical protein